MVALKQVKKWTTNLPTVLLQYRRSKNNQNKLIKIMTSNSILMLEMKAQKLRRIKMLETNLIWMICLLVIRIQVPKAIPS